MRPIDRRSPRAAFFAVLLPLAMIGCGSRGTSIAPVVPIASAGPSTSPAASATPIASATPVVSTTPTASATPAGSAPPTIAPTAKPSATPTPTPPATATPTASPTAAAVKALWAIANATILEFDASNIATGTVNPIHQLSISDPNFPLLYAMAFDRAGNLWVAEGNLNVDPGTGNYTGRVLEYGAAQLAALATKPAPAPAVTLTAAGAVYGIAFDATGNLWASVVAFGGGSLQKFSAAQLTGSGTPTALVTITEAQNAGGLAFANDGTLWFTPTSVFGPSGGVVDGLAPNQLLASGAPTPAYALQGNAPEFVFAGQLAIVNTPNQVAFDSAGDLWSVFNGYVFSYGAATLHGAGSAPAIGFQAYPGGQGGQNGTQTEIIPGYALGFDGSSDLVANSIYNNMTPSANALEEYTPVQYDGASPVPLIARFGSGVPGSDGMHSGNAIVSGPYVP